MNLNLYKINFQPENPVPGGFAFILATDPDMAKLAWLSNLTNEFVRRYPSLSSEEIEEHKVHWKSQWESTEIIEGPFHNGYVICNITGDY